MPTPASVSTEFWFPIDDQVERGELTLHFPEPMKDGTGFLAPLEWDFGDFGGRTDMDGAGAHEWQTLTIGLGILSLQVEHYLLKKGARLFWSEGDAEAGVQEMSPSSLFGGFGPVEADREG
jgi:hypothetical protein